MKQKKTVAALRLCSRFRRARKHQSLLTGPKSVRFKRYPHHRDILTGLSTPFLSASFGSLSTPLGSLVGGAAVGGIICFVARESLSCCVCVFRRFTRGSCAVKKRVRPTAKLNFWSTYVLLCRLVSSEEEIIRGSDYPPRTRREERERR